MLITVFVLVLLLRKQPLVVTILGAAVIATVLLQILVSLMGGDSYGARLARFLVITVIAAAIDASIVALLLRMWERRRAR